MANINSVIVEGNLVKAAELSYFNDGTPYCKFTIANNEYFKNNDGKYEGIASYFDCVIKGNYAKAMNEFLFKGRRVVVSGRLKQQKWQGEDGTKYSKVVIKVQELSLQNNAQNNQTTQSARFEQVEQNNELQNQMPQENVPANNQMFDGTESFEDIPF